MILTKEEQCYLDELIDDFNEELASDYKCLIRDIPKITGIKTYYRMIEIFTNEVKQILKEKRIENKNL